MCFYPAGSVLWQRIMLYNNIRTPRYPAMAASCHTQDIHELVWPRGRVYGMLHLLQSTYNDGLCEWLADECVSVFLCQVKCVNGGHFRMEWKTVCECVRIPMCPPHFSLNRLLPQSYKEWVNVRAVNLTKSSKRVKKKAISHFEIKGMKMMKHWSLRDSSRQDSQLTNHVFKMTTT